MIVYRLTNHPELNGEGAARQINNRWNSTGTRMIYTAGSIALAKGEISRRTPLNLLPDGFIILHIELPNECILRPYGYPEGWDDVPPGNESKVFGDEFIDQSKYLALKVPSVFDKENFNYLINPRHPDFTKVRIVHQESFYH